MDKAVVSDIVDVKSPAQIRAEKLAAAMAKLGDRHVMHAKNKTQRQERPQAHADVRKTFDRVSPGWNEPPITQSTPIGTVLRRVFGRSQ